MNEFWDKRYSAEDYVYGTEPNQFFKKEIDKLVPGKLLLFGEGEGRNAVYAAGKGWQVDAVDFSEKGKEKCEALCKKMSVKVNYTMADFLEYTPKDNYYDAVGLIFIHLAEPVRIEVHNKAISSLKQEGVLILQAYEKEQLKYQTGGPKDEKLLYSLAEIVEDFQDLDFLSLTKEVFDLNEGVFHNGTGAFVNFTGKKL